MSEAAGREVIFCYNVFMQKGLKILIGGAPTVGKSSVAEALARHLGVPWISSDQIREIMRAVASRDVHPKLFRPEHFDAKRFLTEFSAEEIVAMEMEESEETWIGIRAFVKDSYPWDSGFVAEGMNILPRLVAKDFKDNASVKAIFLADDNVQRMHDVIFTRGLWDDSGSYPDNLKDKEVAWATLFNSKLKQEAEEFGFPVVHVHKNDEDLREVLNALGL